MQDKNNPTVKYDERTVVMEPLNEDLKRQQETTDLVIRQKNLLDDNFYYIAELEKQIHHKNKEIQYYQRVEEEKRQRNELLEEQNSRYRHNLYCLAIFAGFPINPDLFNLRLVMPPESQNQTAMPVSSRNTLPFFAQRNGYGDTAERPKAQQAQTHFLNLVSRSNTPNPESRQQSHSGNSMADFDLSILMSNSDCQHRQVEQSPRDDLLFPNTFEPLPRVDDHLEKVKQQLAQKQKEVSFLSGCLQENEQVINKLKEQERLSVQNNQRQLDDCNLKNRALIGQILQDGNAARAGDTIKIRQLEQQVSILENLIRCFVRQLGQETNPDFTSTVSKEPMMGQQANGAQILNDHTLPLHSESSDLTNGDESKMDEENIERYLSFF